MPQGISLELLMNHVRPPGGSQINHEHVACLSLPLKHGDEKGDAEGSVYGAAGSPASQVSVQHVCFKDILISSILQNVRKHGRVPFTWQHGWRGTRVETVTDKLAFTSECLTYGGEGGRFSAHTLQ